jgi:hypothetical protein
MKLRQTLSAIALAVTASQAAISYEPITSGATESAQKLYNFLATNYGSKTVSGIQTGDLNVSASLTEQEDLQAVFTASGGEYPALVGFDFLFANGVNATSSWQMDYTSKSVELATELWNAGGIPAFSWHWKDPSHNVDAFYTQGAGDPYTTFDFSAGFVNGTTEWDTTSTTYEQIVADIDEISALFSTLQDAGVAAIFRPMHECGGTWFWWSTQEAQEYAALYRLVYNRMTERNGIKNLVWVWNPQESIFTQPDWNPGADYYDIIGVDIYNNAYDYQSNASAFQAMGTNYGGDKIFTLSENGPIPDASLMHADNAVWSWYMPWYQSWGGEFVSKTKNTVWEANLADPCVYTLDKMPGWDSYSLSTTPAAACEVGYSLGDLDTAVEVIPVTLDTANGNGWLQVVVNDMHTVTDANGDTTVPAAANLFVVPSADLSGATTASLTVYNTSPDGVWMSMALLTDGTWLWEMPPDGCWVNGGDSTTCTFDVSGMSMDNIAKIYIMLATEGYSGTIYFDSFVTNAGTIASFDYPEDLFAREQAGAENWVTTIALIGGGGSGETTIQERFSIENAIALKGSILEISLDMTSDLSLDIYNIQGQHVQNLHKGSWTGSEQFNVNSLTKGLYILRASGSFGAVNQSFLIQ